MANKEVRIDINGITYREDVIISMTTDKQAFDGAPSVGNCICGELDVNLQMANSLIPKNAELIPYIRDPDTAWKKKGVFYIFNREQDEESSAIKIVAYDAIYRAEAPYLKTGDQGQWPRTDIVVMQEIAQRTGASICTDTVALMNKQYEVPYPGVELEGDQGETILEPDLDGALTMREIAGRIAAFYAGNWIIDKNGEWRLICLGDISPETNYLVTEEGLPIAFGVDPETHQGTRILITEGLVEPHCLIDQNGDTFTLGGVRLLV